MKQRLVMARNTPSTRGDGSGPPTEPRTESGGPKAVDRKRQQRQKLNCGGVHAASVAVV